MKIKQIVLAVFAVIVSLYLLTSWNRVPAGYVGVKVFLLGSNKGVDSEVVGPGNYLIGLNENLYLFPTFTQNHIWTASSTEGSPNNDSITFQTSEGLSVNTDLGISYNVNSEKVANIFQKYRKGVEEITNIYLRNMVRDALVIESSSRSIETVYGVGKAELIKKVEDSVRSQVKDLGINIEKIYWVGELRLPPTVVEAINAKINATQTSLLRENEIAQIKAEAQKAIEHANGQARATLTIAEAEAKAIQIKGEALRNNPLVVDLAIVDKWNGTLPQVTNGIPLLNINTNK